MAYLTSFDSRQLRTVLGTFTTGVTIVTTRDACGVPHGVTANSFSSVSLEPPLVLWSQGLNSKSLPAFQESNYFAVNILADDQVEISKHFATPQEDKFAGVTYAEGLGRVPVLEGTVAHFECLKVAEYPAGDHVIYLGRIERVSHSGRRPLAFAYGRYMVPYAHGLGPMSLLAGSAPVATVKAVQIATDTFAAVHLAVGQHRVCLAVWGNHGPTVIRWERGADAESESLQTGLVMSVTGTATGQAFAAFLPAEVTRVFVDEDLRLTRPGDENEVEQRRRFDEAIEEIRRKGVAQLVETGPTAVETHAFSAPVFNRDGEMVMAVTVMTTDENDALGSRVMKAAREITHRIADLVIP